MFRVAVLSVVLGASVSGGAPAQDLVEFDDDPAAALRAAADEAAERGLAWLASRQNENGFWYGLVGAKGRDGYRIARPLSEQVDAGSGHIGVSALCGVAFLAGGHVPGRGRHGEVVERAVAATMACVRESGQITECGTRMYSHAFATLFLAEVYGMLRDEHVRAALEASTHLIVDCQNLEGGWRYNPFSRDSDLSVTVCQLQALRAARNIGIEVPKATIDHAVAYVTACQVPSGFAKGRYYYQLPSGRRGGRKTEQYSIQAAAVTSFLSAGVYDAARIATALDFLVEEAPQVTRQMPHSYYFWYGNYYASQAFFHAEGRLLDGQFDRYWTALAEHLLRDQQADGRWLNDVGPGDEFGTAVACILLQIPKQYLPIFQR